MAGVAVVTDSTSSLDPATATSSAVTVIPLQVVIEDRSRPESEVPAGEVARALRRGQRVSTSRPTPETFEAAYRRLGEQGHEAIVSVHLSGRISGTCGAAQVAAEQVGLPVTVVDSGTLAMAVGFAAVTGAGCAARGGSAAAVAEAIRRRASAAVTYFYVDSLDYLRRGGRIGAAAAMLGSALAVKPLLTVAGGEIRPYERVRTESRALARLEELGVAALTRASASAGAVAVAVHHLDNLDAASRLAARLQNRTRGGEVVLAEVSAVLGVHVGPGTVGVVISPEE